MLVMKFGGTSVQDAPAMESVINIVTSRAATETGTVVVLSATSGTTNSLLQMARAAARKSDVSEMLRELTDRHVSMLLALAPQASVECVTILCEQLHAYVRALAILGECSNESLDMVVSFGERLSTAILQAALQSHGVTSTLVPATSLIRTDDGFQQAIVDEVQTVQQCHDQLDPLLTPGSIVITQGFIGSTADGRVSTLGRGGSDYSAALIGSALGAKEIQIWTDVSGVYSADPRIILDARPLETISFDEMHTLALYGAKVLHPDTILPAIDASIPVRVLNTFEPNAAGTVITNASSTDADIHAVTLVRPCIRICCDGDEQSLLHLQSVVAKHLLSYHATRSGATFIVHIPTNEIRLAVEVALVGVKHTTDDVGLAVVTGPNVHKPAILELIAGELSSRESAVVTASLQPRCVMASVPLDVSFDACSSLHELIRRHR